MVYLGTTIQYIPNREIINDHTAIFVVGMCYCILLLLYTYIGLYIL